MHHTKKLKEIKDLNVGSKTLKSLEENIKKNLFDTELGKDFLTRTKKGIIYNRKIIK